MALSWQPGGAIVAEVDAALVPDVPLPIQATRRGYHVTLLGRASLQPVAPVLGRVWLELLVNLREPPVPVLKPVLALATDPERQRRTWFLRVENPEVFALYVLELTECMDDAVRRINQTGFVNGEQDRFFHVSVANDQGGDPLLSIGGITREDWLHSTGNAT
jgi:hypothetical protein